MFAFIPDFPTTFIGEKHKKYILGSLKLLLSTRKAIGKYEDKRIMFLYCLVHASKYLKILSKLKETYKEPIKTHLFDNFYTETHDSKSKEVIGFFVGAKSYKGVKVDHEAQAIYLTRRTIGNLPAHIAHWK